MAGGLETHAACQITPLVRSLGVSRAGLLRGDAEAEQRIPAAPAEPIHTPTGAQVADLRVPGKVQKGCVDPAVRLRRKRNQWLVAPIVPIRRTPDADAKPLVFDDVMDAHADHEQAGVIESEIDRRSRSISVREARGQEAVGGRL
jgi:hypothetical protein